MTKTFFRVAALAFLFSSLIAYQPEPGSAHLTDPFAAGWMLSDTNGDGLIDSVSGKIVVPAHPSAAENSAATDIAARIGFATTGFTPPVVISASADRGGGPRIYIGRPAPVELEAEEGGVFAAGGNLLVAGHDDAGLLAAAEAFASRAPYVWRVPGDRLNAIAQSLDQQASGARSEATGLTYVKGKAGINRAFFQSSAAVSSAAIEAVLNNPRFASVHQIVVGSVSATNPKPLPPMPAAQPGAGAAPEAPASDAAEGAGGPARLDLATLYTMRGLFRGTPRMPIPSNLDGQLYVPEGEAGIAMANLAARMGMETTGITLPLATPAGTAAARDIRTKSVVPESSGVGQEAARKLKEESPSETPIPAGRRRAARRR